MNSYYTMFLSTQRECIDAEHIRDFIYLFAKIYESTYGHDMLLFCYTSLLEERNFICGFTDKFIKRFES